MTHAEIWRTKYNSERKKYCTTFWNFLSIGLADKYYMIFTGPCNKSMPSHNALFSIMLPRITTKIRTWCACTTSVINCNCPAKSFCQQQNSQLMGNTTEIRATAMGQQLLANTASAGRVTTAGRTGNAGKVSTAGRHRECWHYLAELHLLPDTCREISVKSQ